MVLVASWRRMDGQPPLFYVFVYDFSQHTSALGHEHAMQVSLNQRWGSAPPCKALHMKTSAKTMHAKTTKPDDSWRQSCSQNSHYKQQSNHYKTSIVEPASALLMQVLLLYEHARTISIIVITTTGFHPKQTHGTTDARFDQAAKFRWTGAHSRPIRKEFLQSRDFPCVVT